MSELERLTDALNEFPGIGPRQARRLAYFILRREKGFAARLSTLITRARESARECSECRRLFEARGNAKTCSLCSNPNRDNELLMIVERESDLETIERSGIYNGLYFILGGTIALDKENDSEMFKNLLSRIKKSPLKEIIIATSATPEGDHTLELIRSLIKKETNNIRISSLGRGLSTGTELEYIDRETMQNAFRNRK